MAWQWEGRGGAFYTGETSYHLFSPPSIPIYAKVWILVTFGEYRNRVSMRPSERLSGSFSSASDSSGNAD